MTNFGLLQRLDEGWHVTCEEQIGGLLLSTQGNRELGIVSTDTGLFFTRAGRCAWERGSRSQHNDWLLDATLFYAEFSRRIAPSWYFGMSVLNVDVDQDFQLDIQPLEFDLLDSFTSTGAAKKRRVSSQVRSIKSSAPWSTAP